VNLKRFHSTNDLRGAHIDAESVACVSMRNCPSLIRWMLMRGAATERALKRCLALADKIARELSKKKPEDFPSTLSLADFQASLERVAEVLEDHPPKK
jgi:hypothetical protein